jgi:hypothetical protein
MLKPTNIVCGAALVLACAPAVAQGAQSLVKETLEKACVPAAVAGQDPASLIVSTSLSGRYPDQSNPKAWKAPADQAELRLSPGACMVVSYSGAHNALREEALAVFTAAGMTSLYSGPNANGQTLRDVPCIDRPGGGYAAVVMSTSKYDADGKTPTLMISTLFGPETCKYMSENSPVAIPRQPPKPQ